MIIQKWVSSLLNIEKLTETTSKMVFSHPLGNDFEFNPGQFVGIQVPTRDVPRAYSIVEVLKDQITFLIDFSPNGINSKYFRKMNLGDTVKMSGPFGVFGLKNTALKKVFISTATGVAPFVPMIRKIFKESFFETIDTTLIFGEKYLSSDYASRIFFDILDRSNFKYYRCITREENLENDLDSTIKTFNARVTSLIPNLEFDFESTEFYVCGSTQMVIDTVNLVKTMGAKYIYFEKYG